jgi:hypothetical protein
MCGCSGQSISANPQTPQTNGVKLPIAPTPRRLSQQFVPIHSRSQQSWQEYRDRQERRRNHRKASLILPEVNGFYGDKRYHDAVWK